jgi:hypothetical protein
VNGFACIIEKNSKIESGASAFCQSQKYAECQANTIREYRNMELGTIASSAFIEECSKHEKEISWDDADEVSVKLAKHLG